MLPAPIAAQGNSCGRAPRTNAIPMLDRVIATIRTDSPAFVAGQQQPRRSRAPRGAIAVELRGYTCESALEDRNVPPAPPCCWSGASRRPFTFMRRLAGSPVTPLGCCPRTLDGVVKPTTVNACGGGVDLGQGVFRVTDVVFHQGGPAVATFAAPILFHDAPPMHLDRVLAQVEARAAICLLSRPSTILLAICRCPRREPRITAADQRKPPHGRPPGSLIRSREPGVWHPTDPRPGMGLARKTRWRPAFMAPTAIGISPWGRKNEDDGKWLPQPGPGSRCRVEAASIPAMRHIEDQATRSLPRIRRAAGTPAETRKHSHIQ